MKLLAALEEKAFWLGACGILCSHFLYMGF